MICNLRYCTHSLSFRVTALKVLTRWYYNLIKLRSMFPEALDACFQGCASSGSFLYKFWSCEKLQPIWDNILRIASQSRKLCYSYFVYGCVTRPDPQYLLHLGKSNPHYLCCYTMGNHLNLEIFLHFPPTD